MPSPQYSFLQVLLQWSPLMVLPSSHCSENSRTPLPQTLHWVGAEHNPVAGSQVGCPMQFGNEGQGTVAEQRLGGASGAPASVDAVVPPVPPAPPVDEMP